MMLPPSLAPAQSGVAYDKLVKDARNAASKGMEASLHIHGRDARTQVFYNNPKPFCYEYSLPGDWGYGPNPGSWRSKDGRFLIGVQPLQSTDLRDYDGGTLAEKASAFFVKDYEKQLGTRVDGASVAPLSEGPARIWKWSAPPVPYQGIQAHLASKYIVEVGTNGLLILTVSGANSDGLSQQILDSVKTSFTAPCFFPEFEELLRTVSKSMPIIQ